MIFHVAHREVMRIDANGNVGLGSGRPSQPFWVTDEPYRIVDHNGPEVLPGWTCLCTMNFDVEEFILTQDPGLWHRCAEGNLPARVWVVAPKLLTLLHLRF